MFPLPLSLPLHISLFRSVYRPPSPGLLSLVLVYPSSAPDLLSFSAHGLLSLSVLSPSPFPFPQPVFSFFVSPSLLQLLSLALAFSPRYLSPWPLAPLPCDLDTRLGLHTWFIGLVTWLGSQL